MTETIGGRRYYNCQTDTGRCGNIVQSAKYVETLYRLLNNNDIQGVTGGTDQTSGECSLC